MKTNKLPPSACPACGSRHDAATDPSGHAAPKPGDVSVCIDCFQLAFFGEDLRLRRPTADALARLKASDAWPGIRRLIGAMIRSRAAAPPARGDQ